MQVGMVVGGAENSTTITPWAHSQSVTLCQPADGTEASNKTLDIKSLNKGDVTGQDLWLVFEVSSQTVLVG